MELGNVFRDPSAKPDERYKMFYSVWENKHAYPHEGTPYAAEAGMLRGAYSGDGLNWTPYPHIFLGRYPDSQNVATYDPVLGKYVGYIRMKVPQYGALNVGEHPVAPATRGRSVGRMESDDYKRWSYPELVLGPDFEDGLNVDLYNPAYSRYDGAENAHFMFPSAFHHREGTFLVEVAVSRDNHTWMRPTRETFIPLGKPGNFDELIIAVAPGFLPAGKDQCALYYRGNNTPHPGVYERFLSKGRPALQGTGRVVLKRDRIVGIEAGAEEGTFWTRPLIFEGKRLVLNAEPTGPDPQLRVQMVGVATTPAESDAAGKYMKDAPIPGYTFDDSIPLSQDELDAVVRWKTGGEVGSWAGKPVRLQFRIRSMRMYAFQFVS
jgi:hypothetical protein